MTVQPPFEVANEGGEIIRQRRKPRMFARTCPYCWSKHETGRRGSVYCSPDHARRFQAHARSVRDGRERAIDRVLRQIIPRRAA